MYCKLLAFIVSTCLSFAGKSDVIQLPVDCYCLFVPGICVSSWGIPILLSTFIGKIQPRSEFFQMFFLSSSVVL